MSTKKKSGNINILNAQSSIFNYLGTGWAFPPAFVVDFGAEMTSAEEDIRQSLQILFSTIPGERVFNDEYGCPIRRWVFEKMDTSVETLIADAISQAIRYFEPRVDVERVEVKINDPLEGILWIYVDYLVRQTNSRSNIVYPFYVNEGTNV